MILCQNTEDGSYIVFKNVKEVLEDINRDRSDKWTDYTKNDWKEGLETFTEWKLLGVSKGKSLIFPKYEGGE